MDGFFLLCIALLVMCFAIKWMGKGKRSSDYLDTVLFTQGGLSFSLRDLCQGALVLGQVGSGKTTGVLNTLNIQLLKHGCGGLHLCAKPDDRGRLLAACKKAGRLGDVILIDPSRNSHRLNFFRSLTRTKADPATTAMLAASGFDVFSQVAGRNQQQGWGDEGKFWGEAYSRMVRSALLLLLLARIELSPLALLKICQSIPADAEAARSPDWKRSFCGQAMLAAFEYSKQRRMEAEFDAVSDYFLKELPALGLKTRSNVVAMVTGVCDSLTKGLAAKILATDSTFDLAEAIASNKIIIVDFDYGTYDEVARMIGAGVKYLTQREILRRQVKADTKPYPIHADEYQNVLTEPDWNYVSMQRSYRGPMVVGTQGWESITSVLGGDKGRSQADVLVSNLGCKFVCNPTPPTAKWVCEDLLGRERKQFHSASSSTSAPALGPLDFFNRDDKRTVSSSSSVSEQMDLVLQPNQLYRLKTGGPKHRFVVGCLLIQPGREHPFFWLEFKQEKS